METRLYWKDELLESWVDVCVEVEEEKIGIAVDQAFRIEVVEDVALHPGECR